MHILTITGARGRGRAVAVFEHRRPLLLQLIAPAPALLPAHAAASLTPIDIPSADPWSSPSSSNIDPAVRMPTSALSPAHTDTPDHMTEGGAIHVHGRPRLLRSCWDDFERLVGQIICAHVNEPQALAPLIKRQSMLPILEKIAAIIVEPQSLHPLIEDIAASIVKQHSLLPLIEKIAAKMQLFGAQTSVYKSEVNLKVYKLVFTLLRQYKSPAYSESDFKTLIHEQEKEFSSCTAEDGKDLLGFCNVMHLCLQYINFNRHKTTLMALCSGICFGPKTCISGGKPTLRTTRCEAIFHLLTNTQKRTRVCGPRMRHSDRNQEIPDPKRSCPSFADAPHVDHPISSDLNPDSRQSDPNLGYQGTLNALDVDYSSWCGNCFPDTLDDIDLILQQSDLVQQSTRKTLSTYPNPRPFDDEDCGMYFLDEVEYALLNDLPNTCTDVVRTSTAETQPPHSFRGDQTATWND